MTDRQHILLLLSATRGIKKGFAALISLCFFGTFSIGLEGGIVNALHKAHNNKETQLGRKENGMRGGGGRGDNPESCAYYLWNLTVVTESILCKRAQLSGFPARPTQLPTPSSLDRKEPSPAAVMCRCSSAVLRVRPLLLRRSQRTPARSRIRAT